MAMGKNVYSMARQARRRERHARRSASRGGGTLTPNVRCRPSSSTYSDTRVPRVTCAGWGSVGGRESRSGVRRPSFPGRRRARFASGQVRRATVRRQRGAPIGCRRPAPLSPGRRGPRWRRRTRAPPFFNSRRSCAEDGHESTGPRTSSSVATLRASAMVGYRARARWREQQSRWWGPAVTSVSRQLLAFGRPRDRPFESEGKHGEAQLARRLKVGNTYSGGVCSLFVRGVVIHECAAARRIRGVPRAR